ncbi:SapC family protein [Halomonas sp. PAMB 3264]|uniref:SapC family protein n=1 Tax=Halomonas sp. PAMB 3264 TaxID=3075222 RepID=UPI00289D79CC|nr:SapC family protein [Halomonas sp. PAMB 3264]WNL43444.1 SapC family protein [Halomonas sp. PAMB 3264]
MTRWIPVSTTDHAKAYYWPRQGLSFTRDEQVVPILLAELGKLLPHYTLGFVQRDGEYQPVALLGLGQGNLYVTQGGKWLGGYVPAALRGYPFKLATNPEGQQVLCIAEEHLTDDPSASPLFSEQGELAAPMPKMVEFLKQSESNRQKTRACTQALAKEKLIKPWSLEFPRKGHEPLKVEGFYRIDEAAFNRLSAISLHQLRGGPLSLAYAQMFSTHQLNQLTERAEFQANSKKSQAVPENLDSVINGDDGEFDFEFDFDS